MYTAALALWLWIVRLSPGASLSTTVSYNASAVKIYNAISSLVHFASKKYVLLL
jgi:hypothetical protein